MDNQFIQFGECVQLEVILLFVLILLLAQFETFQFLKLDCSFYEKKFETWKL